MRRVAIIFAVLAAVAGGAYNAFGTFGQYPGTYGIMAGVQQIGVGGPSVTPAYPLEVGGTWQEGLGGTSGYAVGVKVYPTLVATATGAALNGVFINPTFNTASFGGVSSNGLVVNAGNSGFGTSTPADVVEVNGGVRLNTQVGLPTCNAGLRGDLWVVQGASGVTDAFKVCLKAAANSYSWIQVTTGG
jgi:hypothetical protein